MGDLSTGDSCTNSIQLNVVEKPQLLIDVPLEEGAINQVLEQTTTTEAMEIQKYLEKIDCKLVVTQDGDLFKCENKTLAIMKEAESLVQTKLKRRRKKDPRNFQS